MKAVDLQNMQYMVPVRKVQLAVNASASFTQLDIAIDEGATTHKVGRVSTKGTALGARSMHIHLLLLNHRRSS